MSKALCTLGPGWETAGSPIGKEARMNLKSLALWPLALVLLGGCTIDQYARMLIKQNTTYGKINMKVLGSTEQMIKQGAIFTGRRYAMPDKTEIDVWVLKAPPASAGKGTVLVLHGLCDSKASYYRGLARMLTQKGFDVVLPDLRAHGRSTGQYVTYGALEKHDQRRTMDLLYQEGIVQEPLYVLGVSLGGSVAIQYAALDPRVKGVMAMAPPKDFAMLSRRFINSVHRLMSDEDFQKVLVRAGEIGNFDPGDASALDAAAKLRCPLLLVHGNLDIIVPHSDSEVLRDAAGGPVELESLVLHGHIGMLFGREPNIVAGIERLVAGKVGVPKAPEGE